MAAKVVNFQSVGRVLFGPGSVSSVGAEAARFGTRAMLVTGRSAVASGLAERIVDDLAGCGLTAVLFDAVRGEPDLSVVARGVERVRETESDVIVGIGGGSALDAAKAIAGLATQSASVDALFYSHKVQEDPIPWIAVATTAGSGADVSHVSVLIDRDKNLKRSIRDDRWLARTAIVDPDLTVSNPPSVTAHSGMDAWVQAVESYVSRGANVLTRPLSRDAAVAIGTHLERAFLDGTDGTARELVMAGATMAGIALTSARLGLVHGMAHAVGMACDAPHGLVCAVLLPAVMAWNMDDEGARRGYAELAAAMNLGDDAQALLDFTRQLNQRLDIPPGPRALGLKPEYFPQVAEEAAISGSAKANPRSVRYDDVIALLESSS